MRRNALLQLCYCSIGVASPKSNPVIAVSHNTFSGDVSLVGIVVADQCDTFGGCQH